MTEFDEDVIITGHDLVVRNDNGGEIARIDHNGNLTVRRAAFPVPIYSVLEFLTSAAQLTVGAPAVAGQVRVMGVQGEAVVLRGSTGTVQVGASGNGGDLDVRDSFDRQVFRVESVSGATYLGADGNGGDLFVRDVEGRTVCTVSSLSALLRIGALGNAGNLEVIDGEGRRVVHLDGANAFAEIGAEGNEGDVLIKDGNGNDAMHLDGETATLTVGTFGNEGDVTVLDSDGREAFHLNGETGVLTIGGPNREGDLVIRDLFGREVLQFNGDGASLTVGTAGNEGDIIVKDAAGREVFHMSGESSNLYLGTDGNEGDIYVRDATGTDRIHLDGASGDIKLMGADVAEDFATTAPVAPGTVVVAVGPDEVAPAAAALDRRVVGVASGAGDYQPALRLGTRPGDHRIPVAIMGRVACRADAGPGAIVAGDLLTTSVTSGHAMRVNDPAAAAGAIIGKALAPLDRGTGLIPVLLMLR